MKLLPKRGFTLVELLVVIAIISLLSSVVLASLNSARSKANDARRLADMHTVHTALELYRDATGSYPAYVGTDYRETSCFSGGTASDAVGQWSSSLTTLVTSKYISALPKDPLNTGVAGGASNPDYCYSYHVAPIGNANTYDACRDKTTGVLLNPGDYEYLLYFSVENPSATRYTLHWNGNASIPMNACFPGPHR